MSLNRAILFAVMAVGAWVIWGQLKLTNEPATVPSEPTPALQTSQKRRRPNPPIEAPQPTHSAAAPQVAVTAPLPAARPAVAAPKHLPFELDEYGLAIAFGDIVLGTPTEEVTSGRGFAKPPAVRLWPTSRIPYHIQPSLPNPERVHQALAMFQNSPIQFVPYTNEKDVLVFEAREGHCKSYLGKVGGHQPIWLSENCYAPQISHEIMHALGFIHEQSRGDRDSYIEVLWDNIEEEFKTQFAIVPDDLMVTIKGSAFDFQSIMLYRVDAFAKRSGLPTMRGRNNESLQPASELSRLDLDRLFKIYGHR
jgi:hypothetical protein